MKSVISVPGSTPAPARGKVATTTPGFPVTGTTGPNRRPS